MKETEDVIAFHQNVLGMEVAVAEVLGVHEVQCAPAAAGDPHGVFERKSRLAVHEPLQWATIHQLHD